MFTERKHSHNAFLFAGHAALILNNFKDFANWTDLFIFTVRRCSNALLFADIVMRLVTKPLTLDKTVTNCKH